MKLLEFCNFNFNWETLITNPPYNITPKYDPPYVILKYNQFASNFNLKLVQECRGVIIYYNPENQKWECVARAFDKFFNYGEECAKTLDWKNGVSIQEKIDGSLFKLWFHNGKWHLSTNGTIDAFKSEWGNWFVEQCNDYKELLVKLDQNYCYMFELVSPHNPIVVQYKDYGIWFLGRRNMRTMEEDAVCPEISWVRRPRTFQFHTLEEVIAAAHKLGDDAEGFVCVDSYFNRIKIKGDEYLRLHHMRINTSLNEKNVVKMWQDDSLDDYIAYFSQNKEFVNNVIERIEHLRLLIDEEFQHLNLKQDDKEFALAAAMYSQIVKAGLFMLRRKKVSNAYEFLKQYNVNNLVEALRNGE